ncbi:unnamed protein product, partial [marine sediment metagenome]
MNEYNEYRENKNSNNIKKDGDQSQDNPKTVTFDPVNDTEILEDSNLNDFMDKFGSLPYSLKVLFLNLIKYFEEN